MTSSNRCSNRPKRARNLSNKVYISNSAALSLTLVFSIECILFTNTLVLTYQNARQWKQVLNVLLTYPNLSYLNHFVQSYVLIPLCLRQADFFGRTFFLAPNGGPVSLHVSLSRLVPSKQATSNGTVTFLSSSTRLVRYSWIIRQLVSFFWR